MNPPGQNDLRWSIDGKTLRSRQDRFKRIKAVNRKFDTYVRWTATLLLTVLFSTLVHADPFMGYLTGKSSSSRTGLLCSIRDDTPARFILLADNSASVGFRSSLDYSDYFRSEAMETGDACFYRKLATHAYVQRNTPIRFRFDATLADRQQRVSILAGDHDQQSDFRANRQTAEVTATAQYRMIQLSYGGYWIDEEEPGSFIALRIDPVPQIALGFEAGLDYDRGRIAAEWQGESGTVDLLLRSDHTTCWGEVQPCSTISASGYWTQYHFRRDSLYTDDPSLQPWGDGAKYAARVEFAEQNWAVYTGTRGLAMDGMAYGFKGALAYAKLTTLKLTLDGLFAGAEWQPSLSRSTRWLFEVERSHWTGKLRGHAEIWPWTSGWIDLLGYRRYFIGETHGTFWRFNLGHTRKLHPQLQFSASLQAFDIYLEGEFTHWRPSWLIFGVEDLQMHEILLERQLAGLLGLSLTWTPGRWEVGYSVEQFFPVRAWYRDPTKQSGDGSKRPKGGPGDNEYGGGLHRVTVGFRF